MCPIEKAAKLAQLHYALRLLSVDEKKAEKPGLAIELIVAEINRITLL